MSMIKTYSYYCPVCGEKYRITLALNAQIPALITCKCKSFAYYSGVQKVKVDEGQGVVMEVVDREYFSILDIRNLN